jgi:hypothetical protein
MRTSGVSPLRASKLSDASLGYDYMIVESLADHCMNDLWRCD